MSYATSDKRIAALKDERKRLISAKQDLERRIDELCAEAERLKVENTKLREYGKLMHNHIKVCCDACGECGFCDIDALTRELGIEMPS